MLFCKLLAVAMLGYVPAKGSTIYIPAWKIEQVKQEDPAKIARARRCARQGGVHLRIVRSS